MHTERRVATGRKHSDQANRLGLWVRPIIAAIIYIHHRHLLLLLSSKADTHLTVPRRLKKVDIATAGRVEQPVPKTAYLRAIVIYAYWRRSLTPQPKYHYFSDFSRWCRPPFWICYVHIWTTHDDNLVVYIGVQNLVGIQAVVLILCEFFIFCKLAGMPIHSSKMGSLWIWLPKWVGLSITH